MYKLYYSPGACSMAVHITLEEVGAAFELTRILIPTGETNRPAYLAINSKARVPALALGDTVLTEVPAILSYLAFAHPDAHLMPTDLLTQARLFEWLAWLASEVHPAFGQIGRPGRSVARSDLHGDVQTRGRENVADRFAEIESRLAAEGRFATGDVYSVADPYLFVFYQWGRAEGFDMARYTAFSVHAARMSARPATQRALVSEGLA